MSAMIPALPIPTEAGVFHVPGRGMLAYVKIENECLPVIQVDQDMPIEGYAPIGSKFNPRSKSPVFGLPRILVTLADGRRFKVDSITVTEAESLL